MLSFGLPVSFRCFSGSICLMSTRNKSVISASALNFENQGSSFVKGSPAVSITV